MNYKDKNANNRRLVQNYWLFGLQKYNINIGRRPEGACTIMNQEGFSMMKKTQDTVKSIIMKTIVSKSVKAAVQNVNSACVWILNQPEPPKELKKFRKF